MLIDKFQDYVTRHELFSRQDKILLTVSGGVDSMVLMSLCVNSGYNVGVAHCNFGLRGQESDEDEILVQERARKYGIECHNRRFDTVGEMERTGESMEMAARRLRYTWFAELCQKHGYTVVAVAHHIDDSIETFFINLLRGTGLRGLTGIHKQVGHIVRPLMFATRKEILEYAMKKHIPYRDDSSNKSTKYLRNKIRLGLIPRIREISPRFPFIMHQNIERLISAQNFIQGAIDNIYAQAVTEQSGIYTLHVERIADPKSRDFVIYEILSSRFGFKGDIVDGLCKALAQNNSGKRFYSRSNVAYIDRGNIVITSISEEDSCLITVREGQQRAYCGNSVLYFELCDVDNLTTYNVADNVALIDADKLTYPLTLRRWMEGDSFTPFGMTGSKKVSDFLIDAKVSMAEKGRQFVLLSEGKIVWLVGRRIGDEFRITDKTERVIRITKEII
ncbi:MAG: tRNA lysidine(34) synthetase TilS [Alistipes sp.]|nr:tRNA lysidine(34) synthetase TilS [Alistipes sp.]MBQ5898373.1 tRNA lysidine(34) synthetase TilS [Alistipes sp.]